MKNIFESRRGRRMRSRGALLALVVTTLAAGGCSTPATKADDPANAPHVAVVKVTRHDLTNSLKIESELLPYQEVDVFAKVSGYVQKLYVDWGTHVKQGQILAVLEIPELQQQLEQDEAAVRRGGNDLERAREELNRATSAYSVAHVTYTRLADVQTSQPGLVAQQEIDEAQGKDQQASAGVSAAKDSLAAAEQALAGLRAALEKDKALYAYARITAPSDGVVTQIYAYKGALLPAGTSSNKGDQALCRVSQNNMLRLVIPVPERAVADIRVGEMVDVSVSAIQKTYKGKIARFSDQIDMNTRTMHTEVDVPNQNYTLVPGMYASVQIPLHSASNVLTVPIQTVLAADASHGTALVVNGSNRIEKREVTLGLQTANEYEVTAGLKENERVIFGEQNQYKEGELVSPQGMEGSGAAQE